MGTGLPRGRSGPGATHGGPPAASLLAVVATSSWEFPTIIPYELRHSCAY